MIVYIAVGIMLIGFTAFFYLIKKYTTAEERDKIDITPNKFSSKGFIVTSGKRWNFLAGWKTGIEINKWQKKNFNRVFKVYSLFINIVFFIYIPLFNTKILQIKPSSLFFIGTFLALNLILFTIYRFRLLRFLNLLYHLYIGFFITSLMLYYMLYFE